LKRRLIIIILAIVILAEAIYIAGEIYMSVDHSESFRERAGRLARSAEQLVGDSSAHMEFEVTLESTTGIKTNGFLKAPPGGGLHPALLVLGGVRTGRKTLEYIGYTKDIVMLALDYPYEGKTGNMSLWEFLGSVPRIRRAVLDTAPAARIAVDYLLERDDVDPGRIIVIGGSLGAFFVPAHAAIDDRPAAAVMIYGAGDIQSILAASHDMPRLVSRPAGWLGAVLLSPVEPLKYAHLIGPRPVLMISGRYDERIPERSSRLLHEAASFPKTVLWIDKGHVTVREEEFHTLISGLLIDWLVENELVSRESFSAIID
jgi:pimeloyl-ACP methyl ester carboxylesterase